MKWSLMELRKYREMPLNFSEEMSLKEELLARDRQILDAGRVKVRGTLVVNSGDYLLHYQAEVVLTLPSTRSLEPVDLPLTFTVTEKFMTPEQYQQRDETLEEEILILENQTIDLVESVVDNILLEIPMQVLSEAEKQGTELPSGNDWVVMTEEDYQKLKESQQERKIDPRLAELSSLFDNMEDSEE